MPHRGNYIYLLFNKRSPYPSPNIIKIEIQKKATINNTHIIPVANNMINRFNKTKCHGFIRMNPNPLYIEVLLLLFLS